MLNSIARLGAACTLAAAATLALAQTYPARPVKIMVGANAGGGTDIIARMLADKYQGAMGQPFVVENKPGASNTIAADVTAKAPPDGHTLLVATNTGQAIAPHLIKLSFDTNKDLVPVALIVVVPNVLVVGPNVPANNVRDLIALIKAKPDALRVRLVGRGQHAASRRRGVQPRGGNEGRARALQGIGASACRSRRRPDPARLRHDVVGHGVHQGRQGEGARGDEPQAHARAAGRSHARRSGPARVSR